MPTSSWIIPRQLLVAGCLALCAGASRPSTGVEDLDRRTPGFHVTRLHRYDHSGLDAMLEAELRWSDGEVSSGPASFVQVSSRQMEALQSHHRLARELQHRGKQDVRARSEVLKIMSRRHRVYYGAGPQPGDDLPATGLDRLVSQYVGPIGVGTKLIPEDCRLEDSRSLSFLSTSELESGGAVDAEKGCHLQDASDIWVVLDTGSTNIWVNSDLCTQGACAREGRKRYDHSRSITYEKPSEQIVLNITFGTGKVSGPTGIDDFHVGPYTVKGQSFGLIEIQEGQVFEEVPFEGILGLAFPKMSARGAPPFFDNIIQQKVLRQNKFAFYFSLENPAANAIFWGGADKKFYKGELEYFKVVDPYYWSLQLIHFKIGDEIVLRGADKEASYLQTGHAAAARAPKAIVDTGTTFFTAEGPIFNQVMERIGAKHCNEVTEKTHPDITFRLLNVDGKPVDFTLNNMQYMTQSKGSSLCTPAFMKIDIPEAHGPAMVLGEVFLRHYFSVFDRGDGEEDHATVGFAKSAHGEATVRELKRMTHSQKGFFSAHPDANRARQQPQKL